MKTTFTALIDSLSRMSADTLTRSAQRLARAEKQHAAKLICHLVEISERKVHLELGHPHLFDYCVKRLGLSEGAVALRRQVAGVARRFPEVLEAVAELRVSLTVAAKIAPHLTEDNVGRVLDDCAGMTKREVEEYVVRFASRPEVQPAIRLRSHRDELAGDRKSRAQVAPQVHPVIATTTARSGQSAAQSQSAHLHAHAKDNPQGRLEPARPEVFNFRFSAGKSFKDALVRLAEVTGLHPERDMAALLERAVECALDKSDPQRKHERRQERLRKNEQTVAGRSGAAVRAGANEGPHRPDDVSSPPGSSGDHATSSITSSQATSRACSRHVPEHIRGAVLARSKQRCEYRSASGKRCTCRTGLQIEHDPPFAVTGSHDPAHLKAYCRSHNQLAAEQYFGKAFIARRIEASRN